MRARDRIAVLVVFAIIAAVIGLSAGGHVAPDARSARDVAIQRCIEAGGGVPSRVAECWTADGRR